MNDPPPGDGPGDASAAPKRQGRPGFFANVGSLVSARVFLALSQIMVLPIVARQLTIEDFALMALAMTVVVFSGVLSDAGLGRSLIRTPHTDEVEWSSVFWLLVAIGVALSLVVIAIAPIWAAFFAEPRLTGLLWAMAPVPLCMAISAAPNAEIERREAYTRIAGVQVITTIIALGLAVGLALAGAGVWALVAQQLALAGVRLIGILRLTHFRPRLTFSAHLLRPHLVFARDTLFVALVAVTQAQWAVIAVGRILGPVPLGVFSMSQRFSRLPQLGLAGPMSSVVYVRMAKNLHDPAGIARIYLAAMHVLAAAMLTPLAMIAVAGDSIFSLFLGDEWRPVAPIFALSIPGLALEAVAMVCLSCLFRAMGRTDLQVRFALESGALRIAMVSVAVFGGLKLMAFSLTLWGLAMVPRGWHLAARIVPLARADCLRVLLWPVGIAAAMAVAQPVIVALADLGRWGDAGLAIIISLIGVSLTFLGDRRALKASVAVFR